MTSSLWHYFAYGLVFACPFPLPEFAALSPAKGAAESAAPDVVIELGAPLSPQWIEAVIASGGAPQQLNFSPTRSQMLFSGVGRFTISGGNHIVIEPLEGCGPSTWRLPLLGSVLALLLEQRGLFVLHAGAVQIGDSAAAFLGEKGQGKSTLNAALSRSGYPLLCDDVAALSWAEGTPNASDQASPEVLCGFAQIKLVPDAVRAVLQVEPDQLSAVAPELSELTDKRAFMAPLAAAAVPLRYVFVLASLDEEEFDEKETAGKEAFRLRALSPQDALLELMPHTFAVRFGPLYLQGERKKAHFLCCARVVRECRVWKLARRRDLALLPETVALIARTVGRNVENFRDENAAYSF